MTNVFHSKIFSNVIERYIEKSAKFLSSFIEEVYRKRSNPILMTNNFESYVLQTSLTKEKCKNKLILIKIKFVI